MLAEEKRFFVKGFRAGVSEAVGDPVSYPADLHVAELTAYHHGYIAGHAALTLAIEMEDKRNSFVRGVDPAAVVETAKEIRGRTAGYSLKDNQTHLTHPRGGEEDDGA